MSYLRIIRASIFEREERLIRLPYILLLRCD